MLNELTANKNNQMASFNIKIILAKINLCKTKKYDWN